MPHSTASDPAEVEALNCLEQGTSKLEEGDVQSAKVRAIWDFVFCKLTQ